MRLLRNVALAAIALVAVCAGLLVASWLFLASDAGLRWAVSQVHQRSGNRLTLEGVQGSLGDAVRIARLTYDDDDLRLVADNVELRWSPRALLSRSVFVDDLAAASVMLELKPATAVNAPPQSLALPWGIDVKLASIAHLDVASGENRWRFSRLAFHYSGGERRHALDDLAFDSEWGALRGNIAMDATQPFAVQGKLSFSGSDKVYRANASLVIGGELSLLALSGDAATEGARAEASMRVAPFDRAWLRESHAQLSGVDLSRFDAGLPATSMAANIDGGMETDATLRGRFTARNALAGPLSANRLPIAALSASFSGDRETVSFEDLDAAVGAIGRVAGKARIGQEILRWDLAVSNFDLRALASDLRSTRLAGAIKGDVRLDTVDAEGTFAGELHQAGVALAFDAAVRAGNVDVRSFRARARNGTLEGRATLSTHGSQMFRMTAVVTRLDPSSFGDYPQASLSGSLDAQGSLKPSLSSSLSFKLAESSRWRGLPLAGAGSLTLSRSRLSDAQLNLSIGDNRLHLAGSFGRSGDTLAYALDARDLRAIDPRLEGRVRASGRAGGSWEEPSLTSTATAASLRFGNYAAASLNLDAEVGINAGADESALKLDLAGSGIRIDAVALRTASVKISGTLARHDAAIAAKAALAEGDLDLDARLSGGWSRNAGGGWSGRIVSLQTRGAYALALAQPAQLKAAPAKIHLATARGTLVDGRFAIDELLWEDGKLSSSGEFSELPAAPLLALGGGSGSVISTLTMSGKWSFHASPRVNGTLTASRDGGDLAPAGSPEYALGLSRLELNATSSEDRVHVTLTARSRYADADVVADAGPPPLAPGRFDKTTPLTLSARIDASSLRALQALAGTTAVIDGRIKLDLAGRGSLERVRLTGSVDGDALKIEAPQYGVYLKDGVVRARLADDAVTVSELSFVAGDGRFVASGVLPASADFSGSRLAWKADKLALFNRPDTRLTLSGSGTLAMQKRHVTLEGKLSADEAYFEFRPVRREVLGDDVVVRGRERETPKAQRIPFSVDLDLDFGDRFTFVGEGFDTGLAGKVHVKTNDAGELVGTGTIRAVRGTYTAFGQRLAIERGELYFDGPLDNPGLDVFALRKNLAVEAGVEVTGTVRVPRVQLTSNPPVPDNEKLAWLVLGHSVDSANAADTAALQAAFAALGGMGGVPIGQRIARTFGVDDISLRTADASRSATGGQIVAISKRLSEKLSLVYEQGLSVASNALKIEYALSRNVTLRAEAGFVSGFGIYYSRSFD